MSDELVPFEGETEALEGNQQPPPRRSRAVQQLISVYGHDIKTALDALNDAYTMLDAGSPAHAATLARKAAVSLRDAMRKNDHGRDPMDIVVEIVKHFDPEWQHDPLGNAFMANNTATKEVMTRLECNESYARALLHRLRETERSSSPDSRLKELPNGPSA